MTHQFLLDSRNIAGMFWSIFRNSKMPWLAEDYLFSLKFNELVRGLLMHAAQDLKSKQADLETAIKRLKPIIETAFVNVDFMD